MSSRLRDDLARIEKPRPLHQSFPAIEILTETARDAAEASLACIEMECLLDHVVVSEASGDKAQSLKVASQAVDLCSRTGFVAPFVLRSKQLLPLLVQMLNGVSTGGEADPTLFIRQLISQCEPLGCRRQLVESEMLARRIPFPPKA